MKYPASVSIYKNGKKTDGPAPGVWFPKWDQTPEVRKLDGTITSLWNQIKSHGERGKYAQMAQGKTDSWKEKFSSELGTDRQVLNGARKTMRDSNRAAKLAEDLLEEAYHSRNQILPYVPDDSAAGAVTRASIRDRVAAMDSQTRTAFIQANIGNNKVAQALFEVPAEMSGMAADAPLYGKLRDDAAQALHGDAIGRVEALEGAGKYVLALAAAAEHVAEADAANLGVPADELGEFFAKEHPAPA